MNTKNDVYKTVGIYAVFGFCWIYFSDTIVGWLVQDPEIITRLSIFKGMMFITATSILLYFLIYRLSKRVYHSSNALYESEELLNLLVKNSSDSLVIINKDGTQRYVSPAAERITGFTVAELEGRKIDTIIHKDDMDQVNAAWQEVTEHPDRVVTVQYRHIHKKKGWVYSEALAQNFFDEPAIKGVIASVRDISERIKTEEETKKLHKQLAQAQKMESVGILAGGVAHDSNNMLGVILGYSELALDESVEGSKTHSAILEIQKAAERSTSLTKQLLAFARKQAVKPQVVNLNHVLENMLSIISRLIGEHINLNWSPSSHLASIKIDPSQVDQVLANLCVNARDAIGDAGEISIQTENRKVDEAFRTKHPDTLVPLGEYVLLTVSDNGVGMTEDTITHLFEPFFTTKEVGEGTGLGLATVYGIVRQNNSYIYVDSDLGQGTTFKIFFPRFFSETENTHQQDIKRLAKSGYETILLVEDELMVLKMTELILEGLGYKILTASSPIDAIQLAKVYQEPIHLLISDVVMPEMNGRELAEKLVTIHPTLKLIFMSGYTAEAISNHGILDEEFHFIQKPFARKDLAEKIRLVLEGKE